MSKSISINNFLCDVDSGDIKIDGFNMNDIQVMKLVCDTDETRELISGDLNDVYNFIYNEEWGDFDVVKVIVQDGEQTQIVIALDCDNPVIEKVTPIKGMW